jgi:hypothetical protein
MQLALLASRSEYFPLYPDFLDVVGHRFQSRWAFLEGAGSEMVVTLPLISRDSAFGATIQFAQTQRVIRS